jgi:hypothetical protein
MPKQSALKFTVEAIRPERLGTIDLCTVVLAPAKGNRLFEGNPVARIELARLQPEKAKELAIGSEVEIQIEPVVP